MLTFFARHTKKLDIDAETRQVISDRGLVAIHFPHGLNGSQACDCHSLNPDDYDGSAKKALRCLQQLAEDGGYVFAEYWWEDEAVIGFIRAGSKVTRFNGKWGHIHGFENRAAIFKTLQLERVKRIRASDYAATFAARPRQGTIMRWLCVGNTVQNAVEGNAPSEKLRDLSPDQQEIMCSEFLRLDEAAAVGLPRLKHLILPVGRTLRDIDILGIADDGRPIFAQVTFSGDEKILSRKKSALLKYAASTNCHIILFCDTPSAHLDGHLRVFPIAEVAERFRKTDFGQRWFSKVRSMQQ